MEPTRAVTVGAAGGPTDTAGHIRELLATAGAISGRCAVDTAVR